MPSSAVVLSVSVVYLLVCLALGMWPGRNASRTAEGYVAGDRTLGLLLMYFITGATIFSAFAFLGAPGFAYSKGAAVFYILAYGALGMLPFYFLGPRAARLGRRYGFVTQAEMISDRYDKPAIAGLMALISIVAFVPLTIPASRADSRSRNGVLMPVKALFNCSMSLAVLNTACWMAARAPASVMPSSRFFTYRSTISICFEYMIAWASVKRSLPPGIRFRRRFRSRSASSSTLIRSAGTASSSSRCARSSDSWSSWSASRPGTGYFLLGGGFLPGGGCAPLPAGGGGARERRRPGRGSRAYAGGAGGLAVRRRRPVFAGAG